MFYAVQGTRALLRPFTSLCHRFLANCTAFTQEQAGERERGTVPCDGF